jgi:multidrug efflux system membrane fusion protein
MMRAAVVMLVLALVGCGEKALAGKAEPGKAGPGKAESGASQAAGKKPPMMFPVEVAPVQTRDVQVVIPAVGSVEAFERVQVTARVAGVIDRVKFTEGDIVKNGQVLVAIEPQRYQVAVRSAKAALERVRASKLDAEAGLARRERAVAQSPGLIPAEEIETFRTKQRLAVAEELKAQADLDEASLNLRDAYVRAPVAGTIETRTAQTGQYAQPGLVLATLVQRDPLLLRFPVPEADAGKLRMGLEVTFRAQGVPETLRATITHIAAVADSGTRMVPVIAQVATEQRDRVRPGAFAEVTASVGSAANAAIVPEMAVRPSEKGFLAFVIEDGANGKSVARERVVQLGMHTSDGFVEVREGLKAGEQLVIRGGEPLKEGVPVRVSKAGAGSSAAGKPEGEAPP